jgi:hypothetical protein
MLHCRASPGIETRYCRQGLEDWSLPLLRSARRTLSTQYLCYPVMADEIHDQRL